MLGAIIIAGSRLPIWAVVGSFVVGALVGVVFGQGAGLLEHVGISQPALFAAK